MLIRPKFLLILGALGLTVTLEAQTSLEPIADKVRAEALSLPADTPLVVLTPADPTNPRAVTKVHRTFAADGTFTYEWSGPQVHQFETFRPDGTLLKDQLTDLARKITVETRVDAARTTVETVITADGSVKSDKKSALRPGLVLRQELDHIVRQAWTHGIRDGLAIQSLSPDGGMTGDAQILFNETSDPLSLSTKYNYPEEFTAALGSRNAYVVADLSLSGIASFFMPHHFYLVYVVTPAGLGFVAYFGEDPKHPTFQYVMK